MKKYYRLKLLYMPFKNGNLQKHETVWTQEMISFLEDNYLNMTNAQLAEALGLRKTVTRNKLYSLGLQRMQLEYWCDNQVCFLKEHYKTMGDVEIMEYFKKHYPKQKGWKRSAIHKKRKQLGLYRSREEIKKIASANSSFGGRSYTILRNSSSLLMSDSWVSVTMARTNPGLRKELLMHPEIIEAKRAVLKLKRIIKQRQKIAS